MLKRIAYAAMRMAGIDRVLRHARRGELKVLLYHNVERGTPRFSNGIAADEFGRHLAFLRRTCNVVTMDQRGGMAGLREDRVNVLLTFDDGFVNNHDVALPILLEHGLSASFFLIANCLKTGAPPPFQAARFAPGENPAPWRTVNVAEMRAMRAAGMTIGSHSLAHVDHRELAEGTLVAEARTARARIEELLGEPVGCFAFPWGYHHAGQPERLLEVYDRVFLTKHGFAKPDARIVPRNEVASLVHLPHAVSGSIDLFWRK